MNESDRADLKAAARILTSQGELSVKEADRIAATLIRVAGVPTLMEELRQWPEPAVPCATCNGVGMVSTIEYADSMSGFLSGMPCPDCTPATTPKQEAVTAAVVASGESRLLSKELDTLLTMCEVSYYNHLRAKNLLEEGRPSIDAKFVADCKAAYEAMHARFLAHVGIPRVADHLEDGGKAK